MSRVSTLGMARAPRSVMSFDDPQTFALIGAAFEVHNRLGSGFLEPVYAAAYAIELRCRGIPFRREVTLPVSYRGEILPTTHRADFVCFDDMIAEVPQSPRVERPAHN